MHKCIDKCEQPEVIFKLASNVLLILCLLRGVRPDLNAHRQHRCHNRFAAAKNLTKLQASVDGLVPVIFGLRVPFASEGAMQKDTASQRRLEIKASQTDLVSKLRSNGSNLAQLKTFEFITFIALHASQADLKLLAASTEVISIQEDSHSTPSLDLSTPLIDATTAWGSGFSGAGQTLVVLDTGVEKSHPFLAGKNTSFSGFAKTPT